jgi:hypothetical protein
MLSRASCDFVYSAGDTPASTTEAQSREQRAGSGRNQTLEPGASWNPISRSRTKQKFRRLDKLIRLNYILNQRVELTLETVFENDAPQIFRHLALD